MDAPADPPVPLVAPVAPIEPVVHDLHGVRRVDEYAWLRDRERPGTRALLAAERAYHDAWTAHTRPLRQRLYDEMSRRVPPVDESVGWPEGAMSTTRGQRPGRSTDSSCAGGGPDGSAEQELLDDDEVAGRRVGLRRDRGRVVSPDGRLMA